MIDVMYNVTMVFGYSVIAGMYVWAAFGLVHEVKEVIKQLRK